MSSWCLAQHLTQRRPVFLCVVWEVSVQLVLTLCQLPGGRKDGRPCLCSAGRWWQFIPTFWYHVLPVVVVQSLSCVPLLATLWTAAYQASLSFTVSQSWLKLMSVESVMPSNRLILYCPCLSCPLSFPASGSFPMGQLFTSGDQNIWASASASVLPVNI